MRVVLGVVLQLLVGGSVTAQITFDGCVDFRGAPVASISRAGLGDVAMATHAPDGSPIILYDPDVLAWLSPQTRLFFYGHECGHHALAHAVRGIPLSAEQEADCFGIRELFRRRLLGAADLPFIQRDLSQAGGDWTHLPGPQRAINLRRCLGEREGDAPTVLVRCAHPAHPGGDLVPCSHQAHPGGDIGPCAHVCYWPNGMGPCHQGDRYPCGHAIHPGGDVNPCSHVAHPAGDRVARR